MTEAIALSGVSQVYVGTKGAFPALHQIDLRIESGEFVSIIGPSGCGKTTVLSLISGLLLPTAGEVRVMGESVRRPTPRIGYMLQQDYLFPWRTIEENVQLGLELLNRKNKEARAYVSELLAEMGLLSFGSAFPNQLSGGMRQRAALVRTLATEPDILLLDEPFSALDYQTKLQLEELISATLKARGKTAVLVTHDISEAIAMSDRVIVLQPNPGRVLADVRIPESIRTATPLQAREQAGFHELFRKLWAMFEAMEGKGEDGDDQSK